MIREPLLLAMIASRPSHFAMAPARRNIMIVEQEYVEIAEGRVGMQLSMSSKNRSR